MIGDETQAFETALGARARAVEELLARLRDARPLPGEIERPARLVAAMRHGVLNGGKRLRPFLVMESAALFGADPAAALDVAAALERPFGAVIASPEAAAHWPGELLAVADDDGHAERLAAMHGFVDVTFCGRTERTTT